MHRSVRKQPKTVENHVDWLRCLVALVAPTPSLLRPRCVRVGPAGRSRGALLPAPLSLLSEVACRTAERKRDEPLRNGHLLVAEILDKRHGVRLRHALRAKQLEQPLQNLRVET